MRRVYIAHPLRGERLDIAEVERNISHVTEICRRVAEEHPDVLILSPIHAFDFVSPLGPQDWVMRQCLALLDVADELWVFGDWERSEGCRMEVEHARETGKLILFEDGRVEGGTSEHWGETQWPS
ncbi:DUF4406 domain-containing protein [uncultured Fretibacterium sp.]|uniref:DUF7768 domain-containing protein n=1 Tax=uncultured Fretibacterium sp. TaxID=1678694 RepID=UPI0026081846|nr:DUF4406 domain-containing protein [uncultured Fretibacterium sp.]